MPASELAPRVTHLERVPLLVGRMLYEPGDYLQFAHFPTTAIVSLHYVTESGASVETAGVGNEGVAGNPLFLGGASTPSSAVVHSAGQAYRFPRNVIQRDFDRAGALQRVLPRYTQALITQTAQTAACNRHHSIDHRLSRWLLNTLDHIPSGERVMTQELIASVVGVRREGITDAAGKLQSAGLIRYWRGHISVLHRAALELHACECYSVVKKETSRLRAGRRDFAMLASVG